MSEHTRKYALHLFSSDGQTVESFTWGTSPEDAAERVRAQMDDRSHVWDGWSFDIGAEMPIKDES